MYLLKVADPKVVKLELAHRFFCPQSCVAGRRCAYISTILRRGEEWGMCEKMMRKGTPKH